MAEFIITVLSNDVLGLGLAKGKTEDEAKQKFLKEFEKRIAKFDRTITNPTFDVNAVPADFEQNRQQYLDYFVAEYVQDYNNNFLDILLVEHAVKQNRDDVTIALELIANDNWDMVTDEREEIRQLYQNRSKILTRLLNRL